MTDHVWTPETEAQLLQYDKQRIPRKEIAKLFGVQPNAIKMKLHRMRHGKTCKVRLNPKPEARKRVMAAKPSKPAVQQFTTVDDFIAANGVRRFEPNATADHHLLRDWLKRECGIDIGMNLQQGAAKPYRLAKRRLSLQEMYAVADAERVKRGLQPLSRNGVKQ